MPSVGAVISAGPHPSLDVVRHWKGIAEIVIRAVAAVSSMDTQLAIVVNPRRACARVTVVVLCVCQSTALIC